jgi:protein-tyrosine phosphatase
MLDEGMVHILATDSHHIDQRPPLLAEGRLAAVKRVGEAESWNLVLHRPQAILNDSQPEDVAALPESRKAAKRPSRLWQRLFGIA